MASTQTPAGATEAADDAEADESDSDDSLGSFIVDIDPAGIERSAMMAIDADKAVWLEFQYDRGANVHMLRDAELLGASPVGLLSPARGEAFSIGGHVKGSKCRAAGMRGITLEMGGPGEALAPTALAMAVTPSASRNLLGGLLLEQEHGIVELPAPASCLFDTRNGNRIPLEVRNNQHFVRMRVGRPPPECPGDMTPYHKEMVATLKLNRI